MIPYFKRIKGFALAALLIIAGCSQTQENGSNANNRGESPLNQVETPAKHSPMRLPSQLAGDHPAALQHVSDLSSQQNKPQNEQEKQRGLNLAQELSGIFHEAANRVVPAVVTIRTISRNSDSEEEQIPEELRQLFGDNDSERVQESLGSGVIIDAAGVVLTNYHVVKQAVEHQDESEVQMHDGRRFQIAEARGDPLTDLAVIQLKDAAGLPYAIIGDSDRLNVGDWVLAVGNPFGLEATVTAGIISAKGRGLGMSPREEFLQTDTPINPGNSGGPLVSLQGEVIGINTAISSTTGGYQGIGFTIPINMAKWVSRQLLETGRVEWGYLGIAVHSLTPELAARLGMKDTKGLLVLQVRRNSPASKAGIHRGDAIDKFDEKTVSDPRQLQLLAGMCKIGSSHSLTLTRNGEQKAIEVTVEKQPSGHTLHLTQ